MKRSNGIELFRFSIEKVLKKYGKWYLKMCGNPKHNILPISLISWRNRSPYSSLRSPMFSGKRFRFRWLYGKWSLMVMLAETSWRMQIGYNFVVHFRISHKLFNNFYKTLQTQDTYFHSWKLKFWSFINYLMFLTALNLKSRPDRGKAIWFLDSVIQLKRTKICVVAHSNIYW